MDRKGEGIAEQRYLPQANGLSVRRPLHPQARHPDTSCLEPDRAGSHITVRGPRGIAVTPAEQDPFILTSQSKPQCLGWDTRLKTEVLMYCCPHFITRLGSCPKQDTVQRAPSWVWAQLFCNSLGPKHLIPTRAPLQGLQTAFQPLRPAACDQACQPQAAAPARLQTVEG